MTTAYSAASSNASDKRSRLVRLGHELLDDGLVVRTWGNFSLRSDGGHFLVTPSGRRYETMREADIDDVDPEGNWTGPYKPSGETPMHKLTYESFPDAGCVVHTHQPYASALTFESSPIELTAEEAAELGQDVIPVAPYALPTTPMLHRNVKKTYGKFPLRVTLLKAHGALLWSDNAEETRRLGNALEKIAESRYWAKLSRTEPEAQPLVHSERVGQGVRYFTTDGPVRPDDLTTGAGSTDIEPDAETREIHEIIYARQPDARVIVNTRDSEVATFFAAELRPYLDDFAQLVGQKADDSCTYAATLTRNNAFCAGRDLDEANAVRLVLEKNARAARYARFHKGKPINKVEAALMRLIYMKSYSKQADD
ncbi:class II aldolase/adducin family protein [Corynebacterium aquatimens]|uniref:L-fuculose-phosphate aldolase n=1 Tax=Corynebacterium aquatimens TaxID=1190508 RepID=A0A931GRJ2_9CORY|nr:class II aldolase/adducin family protein [Corynebacterium aquatimens]MBG6122038.1 L-fuculose-phosphate aldolase [Corynebacterium aquatimens]WJY65421.1 L-fuculose phosphate aldolase [Corynebacterium aquatimens]